MGDGFHGGFGNTLGNSVRYRIGKPVKPMEKTLEMALNPQLFAQAVTDKYNNHLKGSGKTITIVIDPELPPGVYGKTRSIEPTVIRIGPSALVNETELANTIAHELNHARSYLKNGLVPEKAAYKAGNTLAKYIGGKKRTGPILMIC